MLRDNQNLHVHPSKDGIVIAMESHYNSGVTLISRHVKFDKDPQKYLMAIESTIIFLQKKSENSEL